MKIYKIDLVKTGTNMALVRIFEIEVLEFGSSKTSITHNSKPFYLLVQMGTPTVDFFHNSNKNKLYVTFDLKEHFVQVMREINDKFGNRHTEVHIPKYPNSIFATIKPGDELETENDSEYAGEFDYDNEDDYKKPCPNCEEMYLEKYEMCENCGYTRYE